MGVSCTTFLNRVDTLCHFLHYPQKPLVTTKVSDILNLNELPAGENVIVAIACYSGYNQEDSLIMNQSSIDRGLFNSTFYRTYRTEERKNLSTMAEEKFCRPDKSECSGLRHGSYDNLNENGLVKIGTVVSGDDVIIGKKTPIMNIPSRSKKNVSYKDNSISLRSNESGIVDRVILTTNTDGYRLAKVRVRSHRIPQVGDKFSSRHGQKGTIGMVYRAEDMPFTEDGITPDIIINPACIPSRMTIGQLLECTLSKRGAIEGKRYDGTPFNRLNVDEICDEFKKYGFNRKGTEVLYNGQTGERIQTEIFIGPTFYQRLKHMVKDKIHCLRLDHDVLTIDGWKNHETLKMEDKIATLKDGQLVYEKPLNIFYYPDYKGKMYRIKNQNIDLNVTANHRMWVSRIYSRKHIWLPHKFELAEDIVGKRRKYLKNAEWNCDDYQFVLPAITDGNNKYHEEKRPDMNSWITFFGIWIAEGWANKGKWTTTFAVNKQRVKDVLYEAVENMGYHYHVLNEKLRINNRQLTEYMEKLSLGAPNKYLPDWVWKLSKTQSQLLIHSMQLGDGCWCKNTTASRYYTSSDKLANQFMQLCLHAGWSSNKLLHSKAYANKVIIKGREVINQHDIWNCSVIKSKNCPEVNHGHTKRQKIQEEELYDYEGPVYCVEVPSGVFYTRRNGKACWTGNSRSTGPVQNLTRQPAEGRSRDGGLRLGEMEVDCLLSHGTSGFLKERIFECSDMYNAYVCNQCGLLATVNPQKNIYICHSCGNTNNFSKINLPFASKLLWQELYSLGIVPRIIT
jgi:hypothetical protein